MGCLFCVITGFSAGVVCGSAICAFYLALGIFSKLGDENIKSSYAMLLISSAAGVLFGSAIYLSGWSISGAWFMDIVFGLFSGLFTGIYIACIAEIVNLIPFIKGLNIKKGYIAIILIGFAAGKTAGSLVYWLTGIFK